MNIAIFSDTHGSSRGMMDAIREYNPDMVIHCGDGCRDTYKIEDEFPDMPIHAVAGNCDIDPMFPLTKVIDVYSLRIIIAHGHTYNLRYGNLDRYVYAAEEAGAKLALYGHTHQAKADYIGDITVLNPGTAAKGTIPTWCLLTVNPDGKFTYKFMEI